MNGDAKDPLEGSATTRAPQGPPEADAPARMSLAQALIIARSKQNVRYAPKRATSKPDAHASPSIVRRRRLPQRLVERAAWRKAQATR